MLTAEAERRSAEHEAAQEGRPQAHQQTNAVATPRGGHQQPSGQPAHGGQGQSRQDADPPAGHSARQHEVFSNFPN